jgi:hypothetical protein
VCPRISANGNAAGIFLTLIAKNARCGLRLGGAGMGWVFSDQRKENTTHGLIRVDSRVNNSEENNGKRKAESCRNFHRWTYNKL